jgi:polyferredoxin
MFTPIILAFAGYGKMSCARICPRGAFLGVVAKHIHLNLERPVVFNKKYFKFAVWCVMMGSFIIMLVLVPKNVYSIGYAVLVFMEVATALGLVVGILFRPRTWCTVCPMGFTTENIRGFLKSHKKTK